MKIVWVRLEAALRQQQFIQWQKVEDTTQGSPRLPIASLMSQSELQDNAIPGTAADTTVY
jgi:hypothetical protein